MTGQLPGSLTRSDGTFYMPSAIEEIIRSILAGVTLFRQAIKCSPTPPASSRLQVKLNLCLDCFIKTPVTPAQPLYFRQTAFWVGKSVAKSKTVIKSSILNPQF